MKKEQIILLRNTFINGGTHRPVLILLDNGMMLNNCQDQIVWDDDNELIIGFTTVADSAAFAADLPIGIIASDYSSIQFMKVATNVNVSDRLQNTENLKTIATRISTNIRAFDTAKVIDWYSKILNSDTELKTQYLPTDIIRGNIDNNTQD